MVLSGCDQPKQAEILDFGLNIRIRLSEKGMVDSHDTLKGSPWYDINQQPKLNLPAENQIAATMSSRKKMCFKIGDATRWSVSF